MASEPKAMMDVGRDEKMAEERHVAVPLELPVHLKHVTSSLSLVALSDSDSEDFRSRSSGADFDIDECEAALEEMACAPVQLQELLVKDFDLLPPPDKEGEGSKRRFTFKDYVRSVLSSRRPSKWGRLSWPFILFLIVAVVFVFLARGHLVGLLSWLDHLPWQERLVVFIALFTLVSFPFGFGYIILNMMAGYLYGFFYGQILVMVSVAVGFSVAFIVCRFWLRDYARRTVTSQALLAVMRVVEGPNGLKVIFLTRLTPIPFGLQNVLFAMTSVRYWHCLLASVVGLLPTQALNTYTGSTVRNMQEVLADRADGYIILSAQVLFSIILSLYLLRKARLELAKLTRSSNTVHV